MLAALIGVWFCAVRLGSAESPPLPAPAGTLSVTLDTGGNLWALVPSAVGNKSELRVLPAQERTEWRGGDISGLPSRPWNTLAPRDDGTLVISDGQVRWRFDPRNTAKPAFQADTNDDEHDSRGETPWRVAARMPASNHDLSAATIGSRLYVAGGFTSHHGFPARGKAFDEIWELETQGWAWRAVARFAEPRIYCATVAFREQVWVLGGDVLHPDGQRRPTPRVEIFDPQTMQLKRAPDLPFALPAPLALVAAGRLWVVGARDRVERGQMASIGPGETSWRIEPAALHHMWALAGASLGEQLYVAVPNTGLSVFDPATKRWSVIPGPSRPRSAQVAAWRGEIWLMGGCDVADWRQVWIFDPKTAKWREGPPLPLPLAWGAAAVVDDRLVVTGGAGLHGPLAGGNYVFSDRTFALDPSAYPVAGRDQSPATAAFRRWSDEQLRGTGESDLPFRTEQLFPQLKFGRLATILPVPVTDATEEERLLVAEVHGPIWTFPNRPDVRAPDRMLDLPAVFQHSTHTYALAFHPTYPKTPYVYVLYNRVEPKPAENVIARFTVDSSGAPVIDPRSEQVILRWPSDGHNGGDLRFGPDGFLYVSVGDRGSPGDLKNMGQRVDLIASGVLRLDVLRAEPGKPYAVPTDNPFTHLPDVRGEFWAYGLRNPWRMWFGQDGDLWLGDNGDDSWESIHLIRKGQNHGWSVFEGSHPFKRNRRLGGPTPQLTPPVIELSHAEARSVIGGLLYQGGKHASLQGQHVFGDFVTGSVWAFQWNGSLQNYRRIAEGALGVIAFGVDRAGELLMVRNDGEIHRLIKAPAVTISSRPFPQLLSATGLFADLARHQPAPGVIPYDIGVEMWSDGADARRMLAVSGARPITIASGPEERWRLPNGSAVTRTLELPTAIGPRRIETQVMYRENGSWRFYTYAWNSAQNDAELVAETGETRPLPGAVDRMWRFASRSECAVCHTAQTQFTIGLTTAQVNRDADYSPLGGKVENQVARFAATGLLRGLEPSLSELPRKPLVSDLGVPVDRRARAYLDVNCAHCHRAGGVGGRTAFQLTDSTPLETMGVVQGQPLVPLLGTEAKIVAPGRPELSELMHRMILPEGGRMPLLGSTLPDTQGIALIREWISEMTRSSPVPPASP